MISLTDFSLLSTVELEPRDEPGRVAIDDSNRAHVALRRGGAVVSIDMSNGSILGRRNVCAAPRGLFFDDDETNGTKTLLVACNGGQLISMDPASGAIVRKKRIEVGLRDVVADSTHIYVTKFRTAHAIVLDRQWRPAARVSRQPWTH